MNDGDIKRFWVKAKIGPDDVCWDWQASKHGQGYGLFKLKSRTEFAHRIAWRIAHKSDIPNGLCVLHSCDNPACVNPAHLRVGTQQDNMDDKVTRGRQARTGALRPATGMNSGAHTHPEKRARGVKNGRSKLTVEQVQEIRARSKKGESQSAIARSFEVHRTQIGAIVRREQWTHI
jgi:hypothetical protein